jgi:hypothetical protein
MKKNNSNKSFQFKVSSLELKREKMIALAVFVLLGFVALQIPINHLAGSKVSFTLFDLFAPVSGAFIGTGFGIVAVLLMQIVNIAFHGFANLDKGTLIRLLPILFGVWFFAKAPTLSLRVLRSNPKRDERDSFASLRMTVNSLILLIPAIAIVSFNLNPVGRSVWYYSLFWLVPYLVLPLVKKSLIARSLASTFIAHSVGGAIWIWAFHLPSSVWVGLIPVVIMERAIMTLGISANYILMNNILTYLSSKKLLSSFIGVDKNYTLNRSVK